MLNVNVFTHSPGQQNWISTLMTNLSKCIITCNSNFNMIVPQSLLWEFSLMPITNKSGLGFFILWLVYLTLLKYQIIITKDFFHIWDYLVCIKYSKSVSQSYLWQGQLHNLKLDIYPENNHIVSWYIFYIEWCIVLYSKTCCCTLICAFHSTSFSFNHRGCFTTWRTVHWCTLGFSHSSFPLYHYGFSHMWRTATCCCLICAFHCVFTIFFIFLCLQNFFKCNISQTAALEQVLDVSVLHQ